MWNNKQLLSKTGLESTKKDSARAYKRSQDMKETATGVMGSCVIEGTFV